MSLRNNTAGFSHLVIVLAIAVVLVVGIVGYRVINNQDPQQSATTQSTDQSEAPIQSSADVQKASDSLDTENIDSDLNTTELDDDVNSLL